jgi:hypothetical protein
MTTLRNFQSEIDEIQHREYAKQRIQPPTMSIDKQNTKIQSPPSPKDVKSIKEEVVNGQVDLLEIEENIAVRVDPEVVFFYAKFHS